MPYIADAKSVGSAVDDYREGVPGSSENAVEEILVDVLREVTGRASVNPDEHFFDDLGADSMVMARFCARIRKRTDVAAVSMKDVYRHPTVRSLSAALGAQAAGPDETPAPARPAEPEPVGTPRPLLCGTLQGLVFAGYSYALGLLLATGIAWISAAPDLLGTYLRSVVFGGGSLVVASLLPIMLKWTLVGRWTAGRIRVWSLPYLRFWVVKTVVRANPLVLLGPGSPLFALYLRALGAQVGRDVTILTRTVPVCADLLTIGDGAVLRKDSVIAGYRVVDGVVETGPVRIGRDAVVGEAAVVDIETGLGDGAELMHASSVHRGQRIPDGQRWHGSPAQPAGAARPALEPSPVLRGRRTMFGATQVLTAVLVQIPLATGGAVVAFELLPPLQPLMGPGPQTFASSAFYLDTAVASLVLFLGSLVLGLVTVATLPRLLSRAITTGRTYPLFGLHYRIHRATVFLANRRSLNRLFGDSSYVVGYLRAIGYDLSVVEQTGSNFGSEVRQDDPSRCRVGSGTMVADGLSIVNADYSRTSFSVSRTEIGGQNFLGNRISYPPGGRTGENCLLATKVMVPVDGPVREGVGLLGSPPFEIPRSVERDGRFDHLATGRGFGRRLRAKNRHNLATIGLHLLVRWGWVLGLTLIGAGAEDLFHVYGALVTAGYAVVMLLFTVAYFVTTERLLTAVLPVRPLYCSIYDRAFWRHERFWKLSETTYLRAFDGTPFKPMIWRALGARVGRGLFDDGCVLTERSMVEIGDDCTLNAGSTLQCHSQEDGTFKSDRITIGAGCTVGVGTLVHYGTTLGDGAVLGCDAFLMKGEEVPPGARWAGNPARELAVPGALIGTGDRASSRTSPTN